MSKKNEIYDVSAELAREFGEIGTQSRAEATEKAWEEYNAQILLDARKNAGLTQAELAKRIGVTYPTIDNIYKGTSTSIKFEILEAICKELDCSLDEILIFDDLRMRDRQTQRLLAYDTKFNKTNDKSGTD